MCESLGLVGIVVLVAAGAAVGAESRLEVTVTEKGQPVPCRVHLSAGGKPIYAEGLPRFERDPHFDCPGRFAVQVLPGRVALRIERGPEYAAFATELDVKEGETVRLPVELSRWIDMNARGWFSGDLHVHRPPADMPLLLRAEDLNLAPVLTHWNDSHAAVQPPYLVEGMEEGPPPRPRCFHTLAQEDERAGGAILLFQLTQPILLPGVTRHCPSGFAYHQRALEQRAWVEVEKPFWWEAPVHVALGRVDSLGIVCNHFQRLRVMDNEAWGRPRDRQAYPGPRGFALNVLDLYYRYLNLGYQIPASAGSASGVLASPLGHNRVYVQLGRFSYDAWFEGLRAGRNFVTNGPMLFATVNGEPPGARFEPKDAPFVARVDFEALGQTELDAVEFLIGGKVVRRIDNTPGNRPISGSVSFPIEQSTWIAVRAFDRSREPVVRFAHTSPWYVTVGGKRPRDPDAARFYVAWMDELIAATEKVRTAAKDPAPFEVVLDTYRRARAVYAAAAR